MLTVFGHKGSVMTTQMEWSEVTAIVAFKRDCVTTDMVCIGFTTPDGTIEMNEQMEGWEAMTDDLPLYLLGTVPQGRLVG